MDSLFNCFTACVEDAERMVSGRRDLLTIVMSKGLIERFCYNVEINGVKIIPKTFRGIELKIIDAPIDFYCVGFGSAEVAKTQLSSLYGECVSDGSN